MLWLNIYIMLGIFKIKYLKQRKIVVNRLPAKEIRLYMYRNKNNKKYDDKFRGKILNLL